MEEDQCLKWHTIYHSQVNKIILLGAINRIYATWLTRCVHGLRFPVISQSESAFRVYDLNNQALLVDHWCRMLSLSCTASDTWRVKDMGRCPNSSLPHLLFCSASLLKNSPLISPWTKICIYQKCYFPVMLFPCYHVLGFDIWFHLYLCFEFLFSILFFWHYTTMIRESCIFLVVLLLIVEIGHDMLFSVPAQAESWQICIPFSGVWIVVWAFVLQSLNVPACCFPVPSCFW